MKTAQELINFEKAVATHFADGDLPFLVHLCGGHEAALVDIFADIEAGDWVLASHRSHYHALLKGIPERDVMDAILRGDSMFLFSKEHSFISSAILGGVCGIAAGLALAFEREFAPGMQSEADVRWVYCFLGDGAEDNGHLYEAAMLVESRDLPCTFIIEDNDRSVDTAKAQRRGRLPVDPWADFGCVRRIEYKAAWPHAGAGLPPGSVTFRQEAIERYKLRQKQESL